MESLDAWRSQANMKLTEVDTLCVESADLISPEQYALLREKRSQFAVDYNGVVRSMEHVQERLRTLTGLSIEFSTKVSSLQSWMIHHASRAISLRERSADLLRLDEARQEGRRLLDELSHEEYRLKAIGAILVKIEQEADALYDFAPTTSNRGINLDGICTVFNRVNDEFTALQRQCSDLIQFHNKVGNFSNELNEHCRKLDEWFSSIEDDLVQIERKYCSDAEQKLTAIEDLNNQAVDGYKRLDQADQASERLLCMFVGLNTYSDLATHHKAESTARFKRHENLLTSIQQAFNDATAQKAANEELRDTVLDLLLWLDHFESRMRTDRDIPLVEDALNQLKCDEQVLRMELDSRLALLKRLDHDLRQLTQVSAPTWADSVQEKLATATLRLQRNDNELRGFHDNVNDALNGVVSLNTSGVSISHSCDEIMKVLPTIYSRDLDRLEKVGYELTSLEHQMMDMKRVAKMIKNIPNVTEVEAVDTFIESIGGKLSNVKEDFDAKMCARNEIGRLEDEFEFAKQKISDSLDQFAIEFSNLGPVSVNLENLPDQNKHQLILSDKHKGGLILMDELEAAFMSLEGSGICAMDNKLSAYKRTVMDMMARYNAQSEALKLRSEKIDRIYRKALELKSGVDEVRLWISTQYRALSEYDVPVTTDALQSHLAALDRLSKDKRLEQRRLDDARLRGRELAAEALLPGEAEHVLDQIKMLSDEWDQLNDHIEAMRNRATLFEKFIDGYCAMEKWLTAKSRMLVAIGSPTTDAAIAKTQVGQIEVINVEMDSERPSLVKLNRAVESLLETSPNPKLATMMNELNSRWSEFESELKLKAHNIEQASYLGTEIKSMQRKAMNEIAILESKIEEFGTLPPSDTEARLNDLSASKLLLNDLDRSIDQIAHLVSPTVAVEIDSMNLNDLSDQINDARKKTEELGKKIDHLMDIAVSFKNEGDEIEKKVDALLDLVREAKSEVDEAPPISADFNRLQEHAISLNALTCKINEMEVDFPYVRAVVTERLKKSPNDELQSKLQNLSASWNSAVNGVKQRKALVTKVFELVRQFDNLEKSLRDSLEQDEKELAAALVSDDNDAVLNKLKTMEKASARRLADAQTLTALSFRINTSVPGPDANKFLRNAENLTDDCNSFSKRINHAINGSQRRGELVEKFNRLVEEARHVLRDTERHVADLTDIDKVIARLTEAVRFWSRSQRELILCSNELKGILPSSKADSIDEVLNQLSDDFTALNNQLHSLEMTLDAKKGELEKLCEKTNRIKNETSILLMELCELDSVGRSTAELQIQKEQLAFIGQQLSDKKIALGDVLDQWEQALANGLINQSQSDANRTVTDDISKMIERSQRKLEQRERMIDQATRELGELHRNADVFD
ncbi:hypothetical protein KIN20_022654 [Parelaphostrongylus tenuis]|uniref:GAR domain-containing protein n=1 Tax=Parelaphostrongylus tenuis TaxID=148309 RepID=A0AAD5N991_PARTN|nr:hypothetical protein KIN20_022654 [Parelaphostrongylus tenuis]